MGVYKYLRDAWKRPKDNLGRQLWSYMVEWRKQPAVMRVGRPTRLDRARSLGYKAKQGFVVTRVRVVRGGRERPHDLGGRRSKHAHHRLVLDKSYQQVAEERANDPYPNLEVLGSYPLTGDGTYRWFEVIMVDPEHPAIKADNRINWIGKKNQRGRAYRGKTFAGRKGRGLQNKGQGAEKIRPSKAKRSKN